MVSSVFLIIFKIYIENKFCSFYSCRLPYDWKTPSGYFITFLTMLIRFYVNGCIHFSTCMIFFGLCKFLIALTCDFNESLQRMNEELSSHCNFKNRLSINSQFKLKRLFNDAVKFHTDIQQLRIVSKLCCMFSGVLSFNNFPCILICWLFSGWLIVVMRPTVGHYLLYSFVALFYGV